MLSHKDLSQRYELNVKTLYNWKSTKPKLYSFLTNSDDSNRYYDKYRELNLIIEDYLRDNTKIFLISEILFICNSNIICKSTNEIKEFHSLILQSNFKKLREDEIFIMSIYEKIKSLSIIQKYYIYNLVLNVNRQSKKIDDTAKIDLIKHYFKNIFLD